MPQAGTDLNSVADAEIATALTTLKTWVNGNIDKANLSSTLQGLLFAGAWTGLTLAGGVTAAGARAPSVRLLQDVVQFKGGVTNGNGGPITSLGTIPGGFRPTAAGLIVPVAKTTGGAVDELTIGTDGSMTIGTLAATASVWLDGVTYVLT